MDGRGIRSSSVFRRAIEFGFRPHVMGPGGSSVHEGVDLGAHYIMGKCSG